ncbi:MAG: hypothetical protein JW910_14360, partial [Anaerolineae bacterium]|nr:hypothetical protein [Anaerolineae bacterium]
MTQHAETPIGDDLIKSLTALDNRWLEAETLLGQLVQQLSQRGLQLSVDLTGVAREARQGLGTVKKQAEKTLEQLLRLQDLIQQSAVITSSLELDQVLERVMDTVIALT